MYWYNPKTRALERKLAPSTDEEAIELFAGDPDSATFVSEYGKLRDSEARVFAPTIGFAGLLRSWGYSPRA